MPTYSTKPMAVYQRDWQAKNPGRSREIKEAYLRRNPKRLMVYQAKLRAKRQGVPFDLTEQDFEIPERCPVLGLRLEPSKDRAHDASPSLDKVIPEFGYVPENVEIISWRANRLKADGTAIEHEKIASFMRKRLD